MSKKISAKSAAPAKNKKAAVKTVKPPKTTPVKPPKAAAHAAVAKKAPEPTGKKVEAAVKKAPEPTTAKKVPEKSAARAHETSSTKAPAPAPRKDGRPATAELATRPVVVPQKGAPPAATGGRPAPGSPAATGGRPAPGSPAATGGRPVPGSPAATGGRPVPGSPAATVALEPPRPIVPQFIDETPHHKVGEFVVYPGVGVCEILNIESKRFGDSERRFYFLRVLSDRARIFLPVANAPRVGLRPVITPKESNAVFTVLKNQVNKRIKDWKKRQALITEKVHSGDPLKAAEVYKRLYFLSKTKGLSHGENVAFVKVRTILADELSIISGCTKEQMIQKIDKILEASYKKRGDMEIDEDEE